jgi:hypothetical protein
VTGALFASLFGNDARVNTLLALTGLNLGLGGGLLLASRSEVSRGRSALIDLGGLAGLVAGISVADLGVNQLTETGSDLRTTFALVGMGSGLIIATYLTRHMDEPKVGTAVKPRLSAIVDQSGRAVLAIAFSLEL